MKPFILALCLFFSSFSIVPITEIINDSGLDIEDMEKDPKPGENDNDKDKDDGENEIMPMMDVCQIKDCWG